ncbi:MAG: DUF255 domain-containing protein [Saprospiraceae bacterium]
MNYITKIFVLLLSFTVEPIAFAQHSIHFIDGGLTDALKRSKTENKPVFLMCYASWCSHCNNMKNNIFTDSSVANFYNQHFICAKQDMEQGEGINLHNNFQIKSYPTFLFLDSYGIILYRLTGELLAPELITEGDNALTPERQLPYLKQQFENDVSNSNYCYDYLRALKKGGINYADVVKKYFSTQSDKQLLSETNWRIIANGISDINSREFQFVLHHQKEFFSLASPERVERKIFFLVKELLNPLVYANDTINYFIKRQPAAAIHQFKIDSLLFTNDIKLYERTQNWEAYKKATLQSTKTFAWYDYSLLRDIANVYLNNILDTPSLSMSVTWAIQSLSLHEQYSTYILCAKLYLKTNDLQSAIQMANKGKEIALKYKWDYSEADKLLKELQ